ncbi:MAG: alpha/beta hydrolase [Bacillota bacterium]|uniref:Alpha/beta fold hydrolase n=1 Tax=Virgibacillus salarius TaxID=447199 RepID=A0A941IA36_9BACI|nr:MULTISPECIES: alpha/beta fold hydrolase [Bacillaceae]NAZ08941.1 alpha/beta fold hydrolase [Agaribacter marinus]MBR7796233.1 alpha/beta fold hydrolase [Virgibacillus salarius]MCC2251631.1 alpha/beta fold hydrolase [Virgibacillus sp. AGTR]MDY7045142.1 alpha/beta fold hydrolase [Virgibacillus sp. M23]QRZ19666.1 alpha/beta fold hydrolase [Virgibacillus sp. AGTR]
MIACLVIHGYTGGPYEVEPLANYLQENTNWHVEVPTLPGHGRKLNLKNVSHKKWIKAAENSLLQLKAKFETIYLIGFSMGGMIAAYLAAKYNVNKLVLLATSGKYLSFKQIGLDVAGVLTDAMKGNLRKNKLYQNYRKKIGAVPLKSNIEFLKLVKFTRRYLRKIDSPVLIAQGQQDGMVPYKTAYYLNKEITSKRKEVVFFERSRHLICLGDDKDTLNQMVFSFLTKEPVSNE